MALVADLEGMLARLEAMEAEALAPAKPKEIAVAGRAAVA